MKQQTKIFDIVGSLKRPKWQYVENSGTYSRQQESKPDKNEASQTHKQCRGRPNTPSRDDRQNYGGLLSG